GKSDWDSGWCGRRRKTGCPGRGVPATCDRAHYKRCGYQHADSLCDARLQKKLPIFCSVDEGAESHLQHGWGPGGVEVSRRVGGAAERCEGSGSTDAPAEV